MTDVASAPRCLSRLYVFNVPGWPVRQWASGPVGRRNLVDRLRHGSRTSPDRLPCRPHLGGELIHRVGYAPNPWAWTPWQYAEDGRFNGRWDDPDGNWRTLYVGASRLACYLEVLAFARADPRLALNLHADPLVRLP